MEEVEEAGAEELPLEGAGQMLARVRGEQGRLLEEIAAQTRIPTRHLELIEKGEFSKLPARTYAVGFSRTYARVLGLDENEVASLVRTELAQREEAVAQDNAIFEPGDPGKIPSRGLVWATTIAALILMAGAGAYFARHSGIGVGPGTNDAQGSQFLAESAQDATSIGLGGAFPGPSIGGNQVVFTALEDGVWVRFYDAGGNRLMEKQMANGESFEIPPDAQDPKIWTGRPDAFSITIGGRPVPKLADHDFVMRDVAISAQALLARADKQSDVAIN